MPRHRNVNRSVHLHHAFHPSIHVYHPDQANPFPQKQTPNNLQKKAQICLPLNPETRQMPTPHPSQTEPNKANTNHNLPPKTHHPPNHHPTHR
jgi:hypothetical protein